MENVFESTVDLKFCSLFCSAMAVAEHSPNLQYLLQRELHESEGLTLSSEPQNLCAVPTLKYSFVNARTMGVELEEAD